MLYGEYAKPEHGTFGTIDDVRREIQSMRGFPL